MARTYQKEWLPKWLEALQSYNLRPTDQSGGLALAYFADDEGVVDHFTWDEFSERAGVQPNTARRMWRDSMLIATGLVTREERRVGNVMAMPLFILNLDRLEE